ncbi:MAG: TRAP transporter small permease [Hydrogenophaga sp.]|uniref:TRAP transporter small permease n=1 Tax=Hydrogenophaga sp. TaxID=1904254 RepID=UPI001D368F15|nr:TRAP transporter small permease [Hydrogenophaga sp.]MBX3609872.1 TRAP transporter small permease [Hydrogenophaga sp.]
MAPLHPPSPTSWAARLEHGFVRINQALIVLLMASMAVLVFANVVMRYVFNQSIFWVEEFTQIQMIWVAYLGAGLALREGRHVAVDMLQDALPAPLRKFVRVCIAVGIALFLLALVVLGVQIAEFTWSQETPAMGLPSGLPYLGIPLGAAAMLLHLLLFWRQFVAREFEHAEEIGDGSHEGEPA